MLFSLLVITPLRIPLAFIAPTTFLSGKILFAFSLPDSQLSVMTASLSRPFFNSFSAPIHLIRKLLRGHLEAMNLQTPFPGQANEIFCEPHLEHRRA